MTDPAFKIVGPHCIEIAGRRHRFYVHYGRESTAVWLDGTTYHIPRADSARAAHPAGGSLSSDVSALMPGKLLSIEVSVGDTVAEKQPVATMESMKMETALYAPKAGRVSQILRQPGEVIDMGAVILVIEDRE
jgi:biotin carboxyl carrier protein